MAAAPVTPGAARARPASDIAGIALLVAAATQLLPGILATVSPAAFYDTIASYPPENSHFLRDVGSWQVALGLLAVAAWRRPALRAPVLGILAVQYALHAVSHGIDVSDSDPAWQGPVTLVLLVIGAALFAGLALREPKA